MKNLREIYEKSIEREIQGVIKVDDESFLKQELEEYVVTEELLKHFERFFEMYQKSIDGKTENMGGWISGFFGSGKSHFLKIISYLLENKIVDGKNAVDYFENKIEDKELLDKIKKSGSISTDVILFNIDSKATMDTTDGKDKILEVFEKVFNEKLGLSTIPHVAELERFLIKLDKYEEFKKYFEEENGNSWENSRNDFYFIRDEIVNSYSKALNKSKEEAENWFDKAEERYELSIEIFANRIREYIETKENNHHVVFLVDEVGQYIGSDPKLMLNLQTIVEDLGVECGGKAWVIVTSQEAIDDVIKISGDDFSKIQGRFKTRLSLSSSDVDEVIKKRILSKKEEYKESLSLIYDRNESIIKNLLLFKSDTAYQKLYTDREDFANTYPFIPYQFRLLQKVFTNIRKQGYAGMHLANGERSILGAFQNTAIKYGDCEINTLIPFYSFYDSIEEFLEHQVKNVISEAKGAVAGGVLEEMDINVLKMLFMLKNIDGMPANVDNLTTLYVSNINDDKLEIKLKIQESLKRLEGQTLIQRNNNEYKFLTDDEQEINREIKKIDVDPNRATEYLHQTIYRYLFPDNRYMYKSRPFSITKYVDNIKLSQQEYEIGIKIITTSVGKDDSEIKLQSQMDNKYVYIKLELPSLTMDEIYNCLKIKEYRRSKTGTAQTPQVEDILRAKEREVDNTEKLITENIKELLIESKIIISGDVQNINSRDPRARINEALEILINNIYNKFSYIKKNYEAQDIRELFSANKQMMLEGANDFLNEKAYEAMQNYIEERNAFSQIVTIRTLLNDFASSPYGYIDNDILYLLTRLLKNEEISLIYSNEVQDATSQDTLNKILKREYYEKTIVQIRKKIDSNLISNLKIIARNCFNHSYFIDETEDGMVKEFKNECLRRTLERLKEEKVNYNYNKEYQYPGEEYIDRAISVFNKLLNVLGTLEFFQALAVNSNEINELSPKLDLIKDFFAEGGVQKEHFDNARKILLDYDKNKDYINSTIELENTVQKILNILTNQEPYNDIHELPLLRTDLINKMVDMYEKQSEPIIKEVKETIEYMKNNVEAAGIKLEVFGQGYIDNCQIAIDTLNHSNELKEIYAQQKRVELLKSNFDIALERKKQEIEYSKSELNNNNESNKEVEPVIIKPKKRIKTDLLMKRSYEINSKEDIDRYIEELRDKLIKELEENKNLIIN